MVDSRWVALSLLPKVGAKTMAALVEAFENLEDALQADSKTLLKIRGIGSKTAAAIQALDLTDVERQIGLWQTQGVSICPSYADDYPVALRALDDAPPTLFIRGKIQMDMRGVAIVGTRSPSDEARRVAFQLGKKLAEQGWTIVSGLALGIDTAAHEGALSANGNTLAVLGGGVLNIYPEVNQPLARRIMEQGALLGENHPYAAPKSALLVARNRIISGLAQHVIVVETEIDGGAMYAARFATEQDRTLHAVILPASGNLELFKNGAQSIRLDLQNFSLESK